MGWGGEGEGGEIKYYIHAPKTIKKNKILHSDQFSLGPGSAVGRKLEREKTKKKKKNGEPSEPRGNLVPRVFSLSNRELKIETWGDRTGRASLEQRQPSLPSKI